MILPENILKSYVVEINQISTTCEENKVISKELVQTKNRFVAAIYMIEAAEKKYNLDQLNWDKSYHEKQQLRKLAKERLQVIAKRDSTIRKQQARAIELEKQIKEYKLKLKLNNYSALTPS